MADSSEMPAPKFGDRMAVKCRQHWHVVVAWWDDDEGEARLEVIYGAPLTLATAAQIVVGDPS